MRPPPAMPSTSTTLNAKHSFDSTRNSATASKRAAYVSDRPYRSIRPIVLASGTASRADSRIEPPSHRQRRDQPAPSERDSRPSETLAPYRRGFYGANTGHS